MLVKSYKMIKSFIMASCFIEAIWTSMEEGMPSTILMCLLILLGLQ